MTDIERAKALLAGEKSLVLCKGEKTIESTKRGVAPMVDFLREGVDLTGFSAADRVVGKAAAMLFVKAGGVEVYAEVLSAKGRETLESHGVKCSCGVATDKILNRDKTGLCPMETAVGDEEDAEKAFALISDKLDELRKPRA